ncbi:DUF3267 domain-containing protein [Thermodesulfobacteriota bacterium]
MDKIAVHDVPRRTIYLITFFIGIFAGVANIFLDVDLTFGPGLMGWLAAAIIVVIFAHEGIHGAVAAVFGYKPVFGIKPPFVYVTFTEKIPRGKFIVMALAPLVILDIIFAILYISGTLKLFADLCFIINTLGASGDVWVAIKLIPHPKGLLVQDTKTGVEIWQP